MKFAISTALLGAVGLAWSAGTALSDDEFDNYMEKAAPVMHYSCASLAEDSGGDTDKMLHAVRMMVAVSLSNRNIDLTTYDLDDAKKEEIKAKFLSMLEDGCASDSNALLAGIVDQSVHELVGDK
jgi:hypothetical protein